MLKGLKPSLIVMCPVRSKAIEFIIRSLGVGQMSSKWPVIKDDYGQPELYSQIYDGESLHTEQAPISVSFGAKVRRARLPGSYGRRYHRCKCLGACPTQPRNIYATTGFYNP